MSTVARSERIVVVVEDDANIADLLDADGTAPSGGARLSFRLPAG